MQVLPVLALQVATLGWLLKQMNLRKVSESIKMDPQHSFTPLKLSEDVFNRQSDNKRKKEKNLPIAASLPTWLQQAGVGQANARSQEFHPHPSVDDRELLSPRNISRMLDQKRGCQDSKLALP